jgi:hypothetical protein
MSGAGACPLQALTSLGKIKIRPRQENKFDSEAWKTRDKLQRLIIVEPCRRLMTQPALLRTRSVLVFG